METQYIRYTCSICGAQYETTDSLVAHIKSHTSKCHLCHQSVVTTDHVCTSHKPLPVGDVSGDILCTSCGQVHDITCSICSKKHCPSDCEVLQSDFDIEYEDILSQDPLCIACGRFHSGVCPSSQLASATSSAEPGPSRAIQGGGSRKRPSEDATVAAKFSAYKKRACNICNKAFRLAGELDVHLQQEHLPQQQQQEHLPQQQQPVVVQRGRGDPRNILLHRTVHDTIRVYNLPVSVDDNDIGEVLESVSASLNNLLNREIQDHHCVKVNGELQCHFYKSSEGNERYAETNPDPHFLSFVHTLTRSEAVGSVVETMFQKFQEEVSGFIQRGSGWVLDYISRLEFFVSTFNPLAGNGFIPLEGTLLQFNRPGVIVNIDNRDVNGVSDNQCFMYSCLAHEGISHLKEKHGNNRHRYDTKPKTYLPDRDKLDWSGITFPMDLKQIKKFETQNPNIALTVLGYEEPAHSEAKELLSELYQFYGVPHPKKISRTHKLKVQNALRKCLHPLYLSERCSNGSGDNLIEIDLLLLMRDGEDGWEGHYCLIRSLSALLRKESQPKKSVCRNCLQCFQTEDGVQKHRKYCQQLGLMRTDFPDEPYYYFKRYDRMVQVPFRYYADFESFLVPEVEASHDGSKTIKKSKHRPCGYAWACIDWMGDVVSHSVYRARSDDEDVVEQFLKELLQDYQIRLGVIMECRMRRSESMIVDDEVRKIQEDVTRDPEDYSCYFCDHPFTRDAKLHRHHDHFTGKFLGMAHEACNLAGSGRNPLPVFIHNFKNYDSHFIVQALNKNHEVDIIPCSTEKFLSITINRSLKFLDSFSFMPSSLEKLVDTLSKSGKEGFKATKKLFENQGPWELLLQKGIYPYTYMKSVEQFREPQLPPIGEFYNDLSDSPLDNQDYLYAQDIWTKFKINNLGEWHDLYVLLDVVLLADCMERTREILWKSFKLDLAHYYSIPMIAFDAVCKMGKVKLDYLDKDMHVWMETGIRGGVCSVGGLRSATANNTYLGNLYDPEKETSFISYLDVNNLYGQAMVEPLPEDKYEWCSEGTLKALKNNPLKYLDAALRNDELGYFFEVDLHVPEAVHCKLSDYPPAPVKRPIARTEMAVKQNQQVIDLGINDTMFNTLKLVTDLHDKKNYVVHAKNLQMFLKLGLELKEVHKGLRFRQRRWMKPFIDFNTEMRKRATTDFEKDFYKLLNCSAYGKTIEQKRNRQSMKIITNPDQLRRVVQKPTYQRIISVNEQVTIAVRKNTNVLLDKPIAVGCTILELSRCVMMDFHYNYMMEKYGDHNARLMYSDTDSLIYHVKGVQDLYQEMYNDRHLFDMSDYSGPFEKFNDQTNKKVLGVMKDECPTAPIYKFVAAKPKMYALCTAKVDQSGATVQLGHKFRAKGIKKAAMKDATVDLFERVLNYNIKTEAIIKSIRSYNHQIYTIEQIKNALNGFDTKRVLIDSVNTLAHGHKDSLQYLLPTPT